MGRTGEAFEQQPGQSAREALDDEFSPIDLTAFEEHPDAGVLAGGGAVPTCQQVPIGAGREAAAALTGMAETITTAGHGSYEVSSDDLDEVADALLRVQMDSERALVFVLADAIDRGVIDTSDAACATQWLTMKAPCLEPGQAARVAKVAEIIRDPKNSALRGVLAAGLVTVRGMQIAVREEERVRPSLPRFSREQTLGYFLAVAEQRPSKDLTRLAKMLIAAHGGDQAPRDEEQARALESLSWWELPGGLTRIQGELSPGHAAAFAAAIDALAKPRPTASSNDGDAGRSPRDPRSPGKRRADALMELIGAAARAEESDAGRATVKAAVTIPFSVLIGSLTNAGHATGTFGEILDAGTARTMACSAQILPMVLGTDSQPLDVGRATRLFAPSTRAAIIKRDGGCTFPGCDRPSPWCEAHHTVPWWVGGRSNRLNGTLLCGRHHHIVHSRGYLPYITDTEVTWILEPDRMPTEPLPPDDPLTYGPGAPPPQRQSA